MKTNLDEQQDATFAREYKFLQKLNHKNIVKVYGFTFNENLDANSLIMEVASGSLLEFVDIDQGLVVGSGIQNFEGRREYEGTCLYIISLEGQKHFLKIWRE